MTIATVKLDWPESRCICGSTRRELVSERLIEHGDNAPTIRYGVMRCLDCEQCRTDRWVISDCVRL